MFFIMGMGPQEKRLEYNQLVVCNSCGQYSRYEVWMTCMCFSFFFIPLFKWDRHYYVRSACCGSTFELDPEVGKMIASGQSISIMPEHLTRVGGYQNGAEYGKRCGNCGYTTTENFQYCPKCGNRL